MRNLKIMVQLSVGPNDETGDATSQSKRQLMHSKASQGSLSEVVK